MFDFGNMVQQLEAELDLDEISTPGPVLFLDPGELSDPGEPGDTPLVWDPPASMRNNATPRGPTHLQAYVQWCDGDWLMHADAWELLIGDDAESLPFCCNATEGLRRTITRIRDFGINRFRYEQFYLDLTTLLERHVLPDDSLVFELMSRCEEHLRDNEGVSWTE